MRKLTKQQIKQINEFLEKGQALPEEYKNLLFETKKEYELIYDGKEREEDIIAETMSVPLQPVKTFSRGGKNEWTNKLIFGDNLQVLKNLYEDPEVKGKIKLIYIDPPFATEREFRGSKEQKAYQDKLAGAQFLEFLRKRLIFLREILSKDGGIYVHLDWKKGHYIKALMDEIFDEHNFVNEIIWYYRRWNIAGNLFARNHDTIFFYARNAGLHTFNNLFIPKSEKSSAQGKAWKSVIDEQGVRRSVLNDEPTKGVPMPDVWDISMINPVGAERTQVGYPTQKPEALLERIIKASSNKDDIVLDAFAGSGTTLAVAEKLGRRWIGIDSSKLAIYTIQKRMFNLKAEIGNKGKVLKSKPFTVYNAGLYDYKMLKELPWDEYRDFALKLFQCRDEKHKVSGIELDGYLGENHVLAFKWRDSDEIVLDRGFIDDLHRAVGKKVGRKFFIIAPASTVVFLEDYIEKDGVKYYILRIPYSVIEEIHERGFRAIKQPISVAGINEIIDAIGFDFIQIPDVSCEYKIKKITGRQKSLFEGDKEAIIKIKKFKSNILSRKPVDFKNLETLSMVMIDYDFDGDVFDMDTYWFAEDIAKNKYQISFDPKKIDKQMMIIYMDIFGNEKREIKRLKDFKR